MQRNYPCIIYILREDCYFAETEALNIENVAKVLPHAPTNTCGCWCFCNTVTLQILMCWERPLIGHMILRFIFNPIMLQLCQHNNFAHYAKNYASIICLGLIRSVYV